ncbi:uncharacterized protein LOC131156298 isoform X2 [Malania oleifera]|uniref:uncharacterized protein LOC131156298 isoform X2 n=1 Tax=Malania oleifera TaxID=397392 RepID=UPI0025AE2BAD|nr:uncharacterized protein LOC131156298 isoform X2 [Malania oleifera]
MSGERRESSRRWRIVKLLCPAASKAATLAAWDEERLDLGSIARTFGLDPATLKLNGHFVSRGADLFASSVTWNSLLSFFSRRGLSTGAHHSHPLIVDGKLCKPGCKRAHDSADADSGIHIHSIIELENFSTDGKPDPEETNLLRKKKLREGNSDTCLPSNLSCSSSHQITPNGLIETANLGFEDGGNHSGLKRKQWLEGINLSKRLRIDETNTGTTSMREIQLGEQIRFVGRGFLVLPLLEG